ncbi:hypothetical protein FQN50_004097 [Emmonsiellopsis sp. PD_5]|nr:hypothetical protein FQN50_004097 [Emmonsiellopsis sp. PD_5]
MESSSNPNPSPAPHPPSGSYSGDYWAEPLYGSNQLENQPFGISWDDPVFPTPGSAQPHQPPADLYSQPPQQWQRPSLQPQMVQESQQNYPLSAQYPISQFQQPNPTYESPQQPPSAPEYRSYSFDPQTFYTNPPAQNQNTFTQSPAVDLQRVNHQPQIAPAPARSPLQNYERPAPLQRDMQENQVNIQNGYQTRHLNPPYHNTINPQFLSAHQNSVMQPGSSPNEYFAINPAHLNSRPVSEFYNTYSADMAPRLIGTNQTLGNLQPLPQSAPIAKKPKKAAAKTDKPPAKRKKKDEAEKARDRAKKAISKTAGKALAQLASRPIDVSTSSDSSDSDGSSDFEVADEPFPLPPLRPFDVEGGIKYDTTKSVWSPRNKQPTIATVRNALTLFSDLVKGIRDTWKAKSESLKAAENQNLDDKSSTLRKEVALQRRLIDVIVTTAMENGHPAIIQRLGEHPIIVSALYSFLLDRHTAADSDGPLTVNILKLMTKFITMDQAMLEKTKNDKILTRFVKKGGNVIKELAQTIISNAAESTKRKAEMAKAPAKQYGAFYEPNMVPMHPEIVIRNPPDLTNAGTKRPREPDNGGSPSTKRVVTPSNSKPPAKPAAAAAAKRTTAPTQDGKSTAGSVNPAPPRPKANMVVPKPTPSLFSSLMSASKKPGTSNAARAAAAAKEKATSAPEQKPTPPPAAPKPAFSFSETMADLTRPKETTPIQPVEEAPPETEEERKKRLRKEERRKLRVSWKPDNVLTEVRLFTHDPEEEIGHDDSMMLDVGDVGGEGRMLKLHRDLDDLDDEDDPEAREETLFPYAVASSIDFSELDPEERRRNFIKRGGTQTPDSPERLAQEQREANTLSVFYTSPADVPISPKEPPTPDADEPYSPEVPFGEPNDRTKSRAAKYFAARAPPQPVAPVAPAVPTSGPVDIASLLKIIQQGPQQAPQAAQSQAPASDLEKTFAQFPGQGQAGMPQMPQMPQLPQIPQPGQTGGIDFQALLAVMSAQQQLQQAAPAFPQGQTSQPPPNLASILSQFQNPPATTQPASQSHGYNQPQQQQHAPYYEDSDRKRMRDGHGGYDNQDNSGGHGYKRSRMNGDFKHKKHPKAGLVPCRYWKEGKCLKGDDCTFRHDPLD